MSGTETHAVAPRDRLLGDAVAWFAEHGVGETSLRTLATALGTSHRMLIYHFGSREGLLAAVVQRVEHEERAVLEQLLATADDPVEAGRRFWTHVADRAAAIAPLYFELAGRAAGGATYAGSLRAWLAAGWTEPLTRWWGSAGHPDEAEVLARLNLAVVRGLLLDLAVTGDRAGVDTAHERFVAAFLPAPGRQPG